MKIIDIKNYVRQIMATNDWLLQENENDTITVKEYQSTLKEILKMLNGDYKNSTHKTNK